MFARAIFLWGMLAITNNEEGYFATAAQIKLRIDA